MSVLSSHIPHIEGSVSEQASPIVLKEDKDKPTNEMSAYRTCMSLKDAIQNGYFHFLETPENDFGCLKN